MSSTRTVIIWLGCTVMLIAIVAACAFAYIAVRLVNLHAIVRRGHSGAMVGLIHGETPRVIGRATLVPPSEGMLVIVPPHSLTTDWLREKLGLDLLDCSVIEQACNHADQATIIHLRQGKVLKIEYLSPTFRVLSRDLIVITGMTQYWIVKDGDYYTISFSVPSEF